MKENSKYNHLEYSKEHISKLKSFLLMALFNDRSVLLFILLVNLSMVSSLATLLDIKFDFELFSFFSRKLLSLSAPIFSSLNS